MGQPAHRATRPGRWPRCRRSRGRSRPRDLRRAGCPPFKLPLGEVPGQVFIGLRTTDVLTHAWDLAACRPIRDLDPRLAVERLAAACLGGAAFRAGKTADEALPA